MRKDTAFFLIAKTEIKVRFGSKWNPGGGGETTGFPSIMNLEGTTGYPVSENGLTPIVVLVSENGLPGNL